jgi:hypothetical protein
VKIALALQRAARIGAPYSRIESVSSTPARGEAGCHKDLWPITFARHCRQAINRPLNRFRHRPSRKSKRFCFLRREFMMLIIYYLVLVLFGDAVAIALSLWIERRWPAASLPIFLALYFAILWAAWVLAVRLSEPKVTSAGLGAAPHHKPRQ